ncbi:unnamed protein product [Closterium sp. NIES-54]
MPSSSHPSPPPFPPPSVGRRWGRPHLGRPSTVWFPPGAAANDDRTPQVHWWRAQAVRFMLRWPSAHLCHVINQQRHTAYGMHVANRIARFAETQSELIAAIKAASHPTASTNSTSSTDSTNTGSLAAEAAAVGGMSFASSAVRAALARAPWAFHSPPYSLAQDQAAVQGGVEGVEGVGAVGAVGSGGGRRCDAVGGGGSSAAEAVSKLAGEVAHEAYMVRPLVAVHVRGTDKEEEMGLLGLPVYMYFAHQVRLLLPDLRHAWINTESQAVIDSLALYRDWTFLYSSNVRQAATANNTREYDDKQSVAASFASLLIASQADVFIGTLGSNWSRLMNELRSTNGRLFNPFIALNDGEWFYYLPLDAAPYLAPCAAPYHGPEPKPPPELQPEPPPEPQPEPPPEPPLSSRRQSSRPSRCPSRRRVAAELLPSRCHRAATARAATTEPPPPVPPTELQPSRNPSRPSRRAALLHPG